MKVVKDPALLTMETSSESLALFAFVSCLVRFWKKNVSIFHELIHSESGHYVWTQGFLKRPISDLYLCRQ